MGAERGGKMRLMVLSRSLVDYFGALVLRLIVPEIGLLYRVHFFWQENSTTINTWCRLLLFCRMNPDDVAIRLGSKSHPSQLYSTD